MTVRKAIRFGAAVVLLAVLAACQVGIGRNPDGSLRVEGEMTEAELTREVERALADPLIEDVAVDARQGYLLVEAVRKRPASEQRDALSFELWLGVADGHLTAQVSNLNVSGFQVEDERLSDWNRRLANRLERAGRGSDRSTLTDVTVDPAGVTMVWRVETPRSSGQ